MLLVSHAIGNSRRPPGTPFDGYVSFHLICHQDWSSDTKQVRLPILAETPLFSDKHPLQQTTTSRLLNPSDSTISGSSYGAPIKNTLAKAAAHFTATDSEDARFQYPVPACAKTFNAKDTLAYL